MATATDPVAFVTRTESFGRNVAVHLSTKGNSMMRVRLLTLSTVFATAVVACTSISTKPEKGGPMNVDQIKQALVGDWTSIAPEVRPSAAKNPDWTLKPFYLKRDFKYLADDRFQLNIVNSAEPY